MYASRSFLPSVTVYGGCPASSRNRRCALRRPSYGVRGEEILRQRHRLDGARALLGHLEQERRVVGVVVSRDDLDGIGLVVGTPVRK